MVKKFLFSLISFSIFYFCSAQDKIYVSTMGNDNNLGTLAKPFKTLNAAITNSLNRAGKDVSIEMRGSTYSLNQTVNISADNFLPKSLSIHPYHSEKVIIR